MARLPAPPVKACIALSIAVLTRAARRLAVEPAALVPATARALGILALFWTIERVSGFMA
ncbi:MAG: hypothetical protein GY719_29345 [bacterium]|nr:hypothetical protein [bacterium]